MEIKSEVPMTIICSKASKDTKDMLDRVMVENGIPADLMVMVVRDVISHFERLRADTYAEAIIQQGAKIEALAKETDSIKKASDLFNMEGNNDNTDNKP